jgi:cobalt/nickel transport protein
LKKWGVILLTAVLVALILSPFASTHPDGLERVAENLAFAEKGSSPVAWFSPMPDYVVRGISDGKISTAMAGVIGTFITFIVVFGVMKALSPGRR